MKKAILPFLLFASFGYATKDKKLLEKTSNTKLFIQHFELPQEVWVNILYYVYFDLKTIFQMNDIYESIEMIEKHLISSNQTISLVCKTFKELNTTTLIPIKENIKQCYLPYLNKKFLQQSEKSGRLYPQNSR